MKRIIQAIHYMYRENNKSNNLLPLLEKKIEVMKKILSLFFVACGLLATSQVSAQFLSFDKVEYNYDILSPNKVIDQTIFTCTNRGSEPIIIKKLVPSSDAVSCTITRDTINPGNMAAINVSLNTQNLSSIFDEKIEVYSTDAVLGKITLSLKGTVKEISQEIEQKYPNVLDVVRFSTATIEYDTIFYPAIATDTVGVYNPQDTAVTVMFPSIPEYMTVQLFPETIQPNSSALLVVSYNPVLRKEWGPIYDRLYIGYQGKKVNYKMKLQISGVITEDFSHMTKRQLKNAPKIKFESLVFNFDTVSQGDPVSCKYTFKNEGKTPLEIRKIKTSCGCTAGSMEKMTYAKGETGTVDVTLNTRNKHNQVSQNITIFSNDPKNPSTVLRIEGVVIPKQ